MPRFDIDAQRALICLFGLVGFAAEIIAYYLTGHALPEVMTGGLITMAVGPVLKDTVEKFGERRREEKREERSSTSTHRRRPSSSATKPKAEKPSKGGEHE